MQPTQRIWLASVLLLSACGSEKAAEPPPVEDTAFGAMAGAMDKARAVEDTTMQHKEDMDRAIEQSVAAGETP